MRATIRKDHWQSSVGYSWESSHCVGVLWISELTGLGLGVGTAARASWDEDM